MCLSGYTLASKMGKEIPEWLKKTSAAKAQQELSASKTAEKNEKDSDQRDQKGSTELQKLANIGQGYLKLWEQLGINDILRDVNVFFNKNLPEHITLTFEGSYSIKIDCELNTEKFSLHGDGESQYAKTTRTPYIDLQSPLEAAYERYERQNHCTPNLHFSNLGNAITETIHERCQDPGDSSYSYTYEKLLFGIEITPEGIVLNGRGKSKPILINQTDNNNWLKIFVDNYLADIEPPQKIIYERPKNCHESNL